MVTQSCTELGAFIISRSVSGLRRSRYETSKVSRGSRFKSSVMLQAVSDSNVCRIPSDASWHQTEASHYKQWLCWNSLQHSERNINRTQEKHAKRQKSFV
eukprot:3070477-Amphidinium_carterae.1